MRRAELMACAAVLAACALVPVLAVAGTTSSRVGPHVCSLTIGPAQVWDPPGGWIGPAPPVAPPPPEEAESWIQCDFVVTSIRMRVSRHPRGVGQPTIYEADSGEAPANGGVLRCRRDGHRHVRCGGWFAPDAKVRIPFGLRDAVCDGPRLRARAKVDGGEYCGEYDCPLVGVDVRVLARGYGC